MELLIYGKGEWNFTKKNPFKLIARGSLTKGAKVWFYFIGPVLLFLINERGDSSLIDG